MALETIALTAATSLVDKLIIPKIEAFLTQAGTKCKQHMIPIGNHFKEYYKRTYKQYSTISSLALKNDQWNIKDIYVPLTLVLNKRHEGSIQILLDKFPEEFINEYSNILIKDTAGMGKSTLSKRMYLDIIDNGCKIPMFIELQKLSKDKKILTEITESLSSLKNIFDESLLIEFIMSGEFVFFLDGYDEISFEDLTAVTTDIQNFINKAHKNQFILTSRPDTGLYSFNSFQEVSIAPLNQQEAYELLKKYDKDGDTSSLLIEKLESDSGEHNSIKEFLGNPLLVSLLYAAFDYKQTIPLKKHLFYRQVYDAYFDTHDLTKGRGYIHNKKTGLDSDDFHRVLRCLGYICTLKRKREFTKDELLPLITKAKAYCSNLVFKESDFLKDILHSVPLFCKDGHSYKWVHKSLQEYFAVCFTVQDTTDIQREGFLQNIYEPHNRASYFNIFDLYYDIDTNGFLIHILKPFLENLIVDYNALETDLTFCESDIELRKESILYKSTYYGIFTNDSFLQSHISNTVRTTGSLDYRNFIGGNNKLCIAAADVQKRSVFIILLKHKKHIFGDKYYISGPSDISDLPGVSMDIDIDVEEDCFFEFDLDRNNPLNRNIELFKKFNELYLRTQHIPIQFAREELTKINKMIKNKNECFDLF